jgi:large subunit ribosomal protein L4
MPKLPLYNQLGETIGEIKLADSVFAAPMNQQVIYDVVKAQRASMRQGTAKTKSRSEVSGGGRKPYRQKGTGHAHQGTVNAPQFTGGGNAFGPAPRDYDYKVNKKIRRLALKIVLSDKIREDSMLVIDEFKLESHKTKGIKEILVNLKQKNKIMIVVEAENETLDIASRNLPNVTTVRAEHISVFDVMNANSVIATQAAVKKIEEALS